MSEHDNMRTILDAGRDLAGAAGRIHTIEIDEVPVPIALVTGSEGEQHIAVLTDVLAEVDKRADGPLRRDGTVVLTEVESFIAYAKRFGTEHALVYADTARLSFTAVLDEHPPSNDVHDTAWRAHRAAYTCPRSPEWLAWCAFDGQPMAQDKFADFIEARLEDLQSPNKGEAFPAPTDVLTMTRNLLVRSKGTFERQLNPTTGESVLLNKTENDTGSTVIPRAFLIAVPVFEGGERYRVEARVRLEVREGRALFTYVLHRRKEIERDAFSELRAKVATETGYPVLAGNP